MPVPAGWLPLPKAELVVFVGLTGVGKTSALSLTLEKLPGGLLPDRRNLTDRIIIIGDDQSVPDRLERFARTRAFRERRPGGMAEILEALSIDPAQLARPVFFDGLRDEAEVRHAAEVLPQARFVALAAGNGVRLARLLGRADPFDVARVPAGGGATESLDDAKGLLSPLEIEALRQAIASGALSLPDVRAKLAIIREEQLSYDPEGALAALSAAAVGRCVVIDTGGLDAETVARRVVAFLSPTD